MLSRSRLPLSVIRQRLLPFRHSSRCQPKRHFASSQTDTRSRFERINSRLPKFLRRLTTPLANAPLTHITAFLILHEITAIIPLFGLFAYFHQTQYLPAYFSEGKWVSDGVEKFGRYFRKKGWLGEEQDKKYRWWGRGEKGTRIVTEIATAYAITKLLLPLRLIVSVWGTPMFARLTLIPFMGWFWRIIGRRSPSSPAAEVASSPAGGTGAVGGGAIPASVPKSNKVQN